MAIVPSPVFSNASPRNILLISQSQYDVQEFLVSNRAIEEPLLRV